MQLNSLLLCSDEKIVRVLRRTLGDLEIAVEHFTDADAALRRLTRDRFEAIIVDCSDARSAEVLRGARSAPCNKRAIAVAILDQKILVQAAFEQGAHFTLYKPVTAERAKSSFRAARALMKIERRKNSRIPVMLTVDMVSQDSGARFKVTTTDVGEGGLGVSLPRRSHPKGRWNLNFPLPGAADRLEVVAEFAWEGTGTQVGLRFVDPSAEVKRQLDDWLRRNSPGGEQDDPPVPCRLTDLSLRACYLGLTSPFPPFTRVTLSMRAAGVELRSEGVVRVMHPEKGMGVEFTQTSHEHRANFAKFLAALTANPDAMPELLVQPEGLENEASIAVSIPGEDHDALIELFSSHADLDHDAFLAKLHQQRALTGAAAAH